MRFIWAARGRDWGFRFLRDGGYRDPLPIYEAAFSMIGDEREARKLITAVDDPLNEAVAIRFSDPAGRMDRAGRAIRHDFVVFRPLANEIGSIEDGRRVLWPLVEAEFEQTWDRPIPRASGA